MPKSSCFYKNVISISIAQLEGCHFIAPFCSTGSVSTSDHLPKASRKFSKPWRLLMLRYAGGVNQQTILDARENFLLSENKGEAKHIKHGYPSSIPQMAGKNDRRAA